MSLELGLLVTLEAKPGREDDVAKLLLDGLTMVEAEAGTVTWYAIRQSASTFGIFDTFTNEEGVQAHLSGRLAATLGEVADDLLASAPEIRTVEILAAKNRS
jgi:quinol monooxygenase YgiN